MLNYNAGEVFKRWQMEMMTSTKLVHVSQFTLCPQATGFWLQLELYIADNHYGELADPHKNFYGTLNECIMQGLSWIDEETIRLKSLL